MGYINQKTEPLVNVKLTDKGRSQLSLGKLTFTNFTLSDGEMVYTVPDAKQLNILRPADNQPASSYLIASEETNYVLPITSIVSHPHIQHAPAKERGFFTGATLNSDYMICGGYQVSYADINNVDNKVDVKVEGGVTVQTGVPTVGDLMLIKLPPPSYTGAALSAWFIDPEPIPFLWYQVVSISNDSAAGFTVEVDRKLPNMDTGATSMGYAYFYSKTIINDLDEEYPSAYWGEGLLDFTDTCTNGSHDVPIWNMNVVSVADIIGLDSTYYQGHNDALGVHYKGLYPYLLYITNDPKQDKIGVIHYTNNTVNNYYGEGFQIDSKNRFELIIPTLLWHKKQFGGAGFGNDIGYTFGTNSKSPVEKFIGTLRYFDLLDNEENNGKDNLTLVGKVFPDLKIAVIENEELITAMSLKSNRNWTLPKPVLLDMDAGRCTGSSATGIITKDEELHVTYALIDTESGLTGIHCEDYATIGTDKETADVLFQFPNDPTNPLYSEFPYFKRRSEGAGFTADEVWIILQKTPKGSRPNADSWKYFNANIYIGSNGCIPIVMSTTNDYQLFVESISLTITNQAQLTYNLTYSPIGDVIVSVQHAGDFGGQILNNTEYSQLANQIILVNGLTDGDTLQFSYLIGNAIVADTKRIDILVPSTIPTSGDIYRQSTQIYSDLPSTPDGDVYLFYNGLALNGSFYNVQAGGANGFRVLYNFVPTTGSRITMLYLTNLGGGGSPFQGEIQPIQINDLRVTLNDQTFVAQATQTYNLNNIITIPERGDILSNNEAPITFGDETFFFGNLNTHIKSTTYRTIININIMPNRFIKSNNPTFNENIHKVAFTELDIYDNEGNVVAVGKFSLPLQRKLNTDVQIINAIIDF